MAGIPLSERPIRPIIEWRDEMIREQTNWCDVQGYAWPQAAYRGERVGLHISSRSGDFGLRVIRDGAAEEVVLTRNVSGVVYREPAEGVAAAGCGWPVTLEIDTLGFRPGFYLVEFVPSGSESNPEKWGHAFFIVKPAKDARAPILMKLATNTYNAYNHWGGPSLYDGGSCVAYDRPLIRGVLRRYGEAQGLRAGFPPGGRSGDPNQTEYYRYCVENGFSIRVPLAGWFNWERRLFRWAESVGYKIDFCLDNDVQDEDTLDGYKLVVSVGHDEYWTMAARDGMLDWVKSGGNLAVLSGNTAYWHVRLESGRMVCHKYNAEENDPVVGTDSQHLISGPFSHRWLGKPETSLIGASSSGGLYARFGGGVPKGSGAFQICRPDHWALKGTDLRYGDQFGGKAAIVSFEVNGARYRLGEDGLPYPTGEFGTPTEFEIIGTSPAILWSSNPRYRDMPAILTPPPGALGDAEAVAQAAYGLTDPELVARLRIGAATMGSMQLGEGHVFSGSTTDWAMGLGVDPMVDLVTRNVFDRLSKNQERSQT